MSQNSSESVIKSCDEADLTGTSTIKSDIRIENEPEQYIEASRLKHKLQDLLTYRPSSIVSELRRLSFLSFGGLKREFESRNIVNSLPVEILAEIFRLGQESEIMDGALLPVSHLTVAAVSQRFREIVISSPFLWRRIYVSDVSPYHRTHTWVERSSQNPLIITIDWSTEEKGKRTRQVSDIHEVMQILLPNCDRWSSFDFSSNDYDLIFYVLQRLEGLDVPLLQDLELNHHEDSEANEHFPWPEMAQSFNILGNAPSLKAIDLWGVHIDWSSALFRHLQSLSLAYHCMDVRPSSDQFFRILSDSAPTLRTLELECSGPCPPSWDNPWPSESIPLPNLRDLSIAFHPAYFVKALLPLLDAPNVQSLGLDFELAEDENEEDWNQVVKVLCTGGFVPNTKRRGAPLFPSIKKLLLSALSASKPNIAVLLYYHPEIFSLEMNFHYIDSTFLLCLTRPIQHLINSGTYIFPDWIPEELKEEVMSPPRHAVNDRSHQIWLLPRLKVFRAYNLSGEHIRLAVASRLEAGIPILEVYYSDGSPMRVSDRHWLTTHLDAFEEFIDSDDETDGSISE